MNIFPSGAVEKQSCFYKYNEDNEIKCFYCL